MTNEKKCSCNNLQNGDIIVHKDGKCVVCGRSVADMNERLNKEPWIARFERELLKYLEYLNLKAAFQANRPPYDENLGYPEFGTLKSLVSEIREEAYKKGQRDAETACKIAYIEGFKDAAKIDTDGEVVKNGRVETYEKGVSDAVREILEHMYNLFPVPNHDNFQLLPDREQILWLGRGEVMTELQKNIDEFAKENGIEI